MMFFFVVMFAREITIYTFAPALRMKHVLCRVGLLQLVDTESVLQNIDLASKIRPNNLQKIYEALSLSSFSA
jgi:hypothetical protein